MRNYPEISTELLDAAKEGAEDAWDEIIKLLLPQVTDIVRNQIRKRDDHEDIVQEVLVKIFMKIEQFNATRPFRHWVSRLAINTCYDWLRKYKSRPMVTWSDFDEHQRLMLEKVMVGDDTDHKEGIQMARELLDKLIAALKPQEQMVIRLLDLDENSVNEVSELTGWGASKIKVTAMRARRKMAGQLAKMERKFD